jgi:hypothetical protein
VDIQQIILAIGAVIAGSGGIWAIWRVIKGFLPENAKRDSVVEEILRQLHNQSMKGQEVAPSVPDRATALQYVEAVLRYMEAHGSKEGVEALVTVLSEIAQPTTPRD